MYRKNKAGKTVVLSGKVYTMDKDHTVAEAVAIKDEKIIYIGNDEKAAMYIDDDTKVVDAYGNAVLPGFFGPHVRTPGNGDNAIFIPDPNLFCAIQIGVTRTLVNANLHQVEPAVHMNEPKWLLNKDDRVAVMDMVKAYIVNGAYANRIDHEVGSIEKGKYGDIIIIDQDIFNIDPMTIENTRVLKTLFGGEVVFEQEWL